MIGQGARRRGSRFSVEALERADSAMTRRCRAEECWSQTHHVRRLVSPIKPWSNPGHGSHRSVHGKLITRTASMCNGHPLRRYGENRPIGASYPSMTHNISFILLKRALVGRLPFVAWHIRPRRVYQYREGGGSSSESILGESGKWRGHRAACMGDVRMSLCGDTR